MMFILQCGFFFQKYDVFVVLLFDLSTKLLLEFHHKMKFPHVWIFVVVKDLSRSESCVNCTIMLSHLVNLNEWIRMSVASSGMNFRRTLFLSSKNLGWTTTFLMWPWCVKITNTLMHTIWLYLLQSTFLRPCSLEKKISSFDLYEIQYDRPYWRITINNSNKQYNSPFWITIAREVKVSVFFSAGKGWQNLEMQNMWKNKQRKGPNEEAH